MPRADKYSQHSSIICSLLSFRFRDTSNKDFLDIQGTIECTFSYKPVRDITNR